MVRDINFFSPYIKEQEATSVQIAIRATAAVVLIGIAGTLGYNTFQLTSLNKDIKTVTTNLNDRVFVEQHKIAQQVALEKGLLNGYNKALTTVHDGIVDRSIIDTAIIKQINSTVPTGVNLESLEIKDGTITIKAASRNDKEIADFKYNIDKLPIIKESFIPAINPNAGSEPKYQFSMTCSLQEVE